MSFELEPCFAYNLKIGTMLEASGMLDIVTLCQNLKIITCAIYYTFSYRALSKNISLGSNCWSTRCKYNSFFCSTLPFICKKLPHKSNKIKIFILEHYFL